MALIINHIYHYSLNDKLLDWLGYKSSEEIASSGKPMLEKLIPPPSQSKIVAAYQASMQEMVGSTLPLSWLTKSGRTLKTTVILVPISFDNHLLALHFVELERDNSLR